MAWVAIPNNPDWEYDNAATAADCIAANGTTASGIRTFTSASGGVHLMYVKVRRVGETGDTSKGELSKSFWDAKGDEDE